MRHLNVYIDETLVGTLSENGNVWQFDYHRDWLSRADCFDLSPALPRSAGQVLDGGTSRPVQWYFDNLLPEERLREVVAKEAGLKDAQDAFALLTYLGAESAGSLTLLPPDVPLPTERRLQPLSRAELSERIQRMPRDTLTKNAPKRMSVAGAQHKLLVVLLGQAMYEPVGATPSTYIVKPDHPLTQTYPASAFNEWLTMTLAHEARLSVPEVGLLRVPQPVYFIERFDRETLGRARRRKSDEAAPEPPQTRRLHVIDACQLLNIDRVFKHSAATLDSLVTIIERCTARLATRIALFRWLVFNILVGNDDAHLKNLSFFVDHEGVRLAPHYDLLFTGAYHTKAIADDEGKWPNVPLSYKLPGASTFGEVTHEAVMAAADFIGLKAPTAQRVLDEVTRRVEVSFRRFAEAHPTLEHEEPAQHAQEARLLRVIDHLVLGEMLPRLRG